MKKQEYFTEEFRHEAVHSGYGNGFYVELSAIDPGVGEVHPRHLVTPDTGYSD